MGSARIARDIGAGEGPFVVREVQLREAGAVRHDHRVAGIDAVFLRQDDLPESIVASHPVAGAT